MKFLILTFGIFLGWTSCSNEEVTIIKNVDVFDGETLLENVDFVFSENSIQRISPNKKYFGKSTIIDGKGKTIIPPMINAHVHVRSAENLKEALHVGIFGMLDMFSTDRRANGLRVNNDSVGYAKFYSSNVGATVPGGHGTQFGINIPTINDSISPHQFVHDRINQKADYIKITHESTMNRLDSIRLQEVIKETHQLNKIAVAHISDLAHGMEAINLNVDGLAHLWYRKNSIASASDLAQIHEQKTFVIPTLSVIFKVQKYATGSGLGENFLSSEELMNEVKKLNEKGITILAGTDAPNFGMNFTTQYFEELILLKNCGLTEIEVLKAATVNIYNRFNLENFGILKEEQTPSFILVDGKPHLQIEDLKNDKRIWQNGIEII